MLNGIRQGSIVSPHLFNVYVDEMNERLNRSKVGCFISNTPMNNFSYADDLALVAPSAASLNELLKICGCFAKEHFIIFLGIKYFFSSLGMKYLFCPANNEKVN